MTPTRDTPTPAGLTPEQAHAYHERAGIMEYDGHLPRQMAEAVALAGVRRANAGGQRAGDSRYAEPPCSQVESKKEG
jgi:hypothetical protein